MFARQFAGFVFSPALLAGAGKLNFAQTRKMAIQHKLTRAIEKGGSSAHCFMSMPLLRSLVVLVGALAACRSERLAMVLPASPIQPHSSAITHCPMPALSPLPKPIGPAPVAGAPAPAALPPRPAPMVRAQPVAPTRALQVRQRQRRSDGHAAATRRHDPRPRYFIKLFLIASLILTVLLGLVIWAAFSGGLVGGILLGLLALPLAAADVFAFIGLFEGLADL